MIKPGKRGAKMGAIAGTMELAGKAIDALFLEARAQAICPRADNKHDIRGGHAERPGCLDPLERVARPLSIIAVCLGGRGPTFSACRPWCAPVTGKIHGHVEPPAATGTHSDCGCGAVRFPPASRRPEPIGGRTAAGVAPPYPGMRSARTKSAAARAAKLRVTRAARDLEKARVSLKPLAAPGHRRDGAVFAAGRHAVPAVRVAANG